MQCRMGKGRLRQIVARLVWLVAACGLVLGVWWLETERATVTQQPLNTGAGAITLYFEDAPEGPLVFVAHGFAGSRQMMQYISRDLSRAGFTVAAFDFYGHGRDGQRLSPDVTRIEGTTQQLVGQTKAVIEAVRSELDTAGPIAMVGHSMATDIVIRAAAEVSDVADIVAISMHSDVITPTFPARLLVVSGSMEHRLRKVGRDVLAQVDATAVEGQTVQRGQVTRRAVAIPNTEHVAVLFSTATMAETGTWLVQSFSLPVAGKPVSVGLAILAVLFSIVILVWPVFYSFKRLENPRNTLTAKQFIVCLFIPSPLAFLAATYAGGSLMGSAAFGSLLVFFLVWGGAALGTLLVYGYRPKMPQTTAAAVLLIWALGVFALALDRYAAAFVPTGPRIPLMVCLLPGTLLFALADRLLVASAPLWRRGLARAIPIFTLAACMIVNPDNLGVSFTVLPVMVLFYVVYGTMAGVVARRTNPETAALVLGVILAWSIAASTPLFAG